MEYYSATKRNDRYSNSHKHQRCYVHSKKPVLGFPGGAGGIVNVYMYTYVYIYDFYLSHLATDLVNAWKLIVKKT